MASKSLVIKSSECFRHSPWTLSCSAYTDFSDYSGVHRVEQRNVPGLVRLCAPLLELPGASRDPRFVSLDPVDSAAPGVTAADDFLLLRQLSWSAGWTGWPGVRGVEGL